VPLIGIVHGRCFAGNAALLGCCDVIIATESATIGMGGPAMIEGGGLGVYQPEEVGPVGNAGAERRHRYRSARRGRGGAVAKRYLSYFQGPLADWKCADQRLLRSAIPENRLRVYDIRSVISTLADEDSVLELRSSFGIGIVTALMRIEGHPFGVIANNPVHLGGAIDADASDKAARFIQLCDAHDTPILSLTDTPGFMVGPRPKSRRWFDAPAACSSTALRRPCLISPSCCAKATASGRWRWRAATITARSSQCPGRPGEFGGMGLEGAVRLAYRKELAAIPDPDQREAEFRRRVALSYERRQGDQHRLGARDRRCDRSDGDAPLGAARAQERGAASGAHRQEAQQIEPW